MKTSLVLLCMGMSFGISTAFAGTGQIGSANTDGAFSVEIPGSAQHGITLQSLMETYDLCISGNSSRPDIVSFVQKVALSVGLNKPNAEDPDVSVMREMNYKPTANLKGGSFNPVDDVIYGASEANSSGYQEIELEQLNWDIIKDGFHDCMKANTDCAISSVYFQNFFRDPKTPIIRADRLLLNIKPNLGDRTGIRNITLISEEKTTLPVFQYTSMDKDSDYDQMGRYAPEGSVVRGVSIRVSNTMRNPVQFVNADTLKSTKVTADFNDLVSCLKTEAAKKLQ